jgi:hypothetical protein
MKERNRMRTLINRFRPALGFAAALIAVALLAAACAGSSDASSGVASADEGQEAETPEGTDSEAAPLDADAQALVFAECVRDNGVDMPDPGPGRQGLVDAYQAVARDYDRATLEQALTACQDLLPQYPQEQHPTGDDFLLVLAECLREQGLDVSDNPFEDAHSGAIDVNEFSAAMEVCRNELAGGGQ